MAQQLNEVTLGTGKYGSLNAEQVIEKPSIQNTSMANISSLIWYLIREKNPFR
jgi:hypothetical protein